METELYEYELNRHNQDNRKRTTGAGRKFEQSLAQRTVGVLAYLRLNTSQTVIATMVGLQQYEISRDLRRLLPLIRDVLPRPEIWEVNDDDFAAMLSEQLEDEFALIDATEQRVSRPGKNNEIRKLFFSGKQHEFTLKTQQMVIVHCSSQCTCSWFNARQKTLQSITNLRTITNRLFSDNRKIDAIRYTNQHKIIH